MSSDQLYPLVTGRKGSPLFIVPSAGATPLSFVKLARSIKSSHPVYSFGYAGMEDDSPSYSSIDEIGSVFVADIRKVQDSGPYYICGHCFGAIVALDIVTKLEATGERVAALIVVEAIPPVSESVEAGVPDGLSHDHNKSLISKVQEALGVMFKETYLRLSLLPPELSERFGRFYGDQIAMGFEYKAIRTYADVILLKTSTHGDEVFSGWKNLCLGQYEERRLQGDAFSILEPPEVRNLAARLDAILSREQGSTRSVPPGTG